MGDSKFKDYFMTLKLILNLKPNYFNFSYAIYKGNSKEELKFVFAWSLNQIKLTIYII